MKTLSKYIADAGINEGRQEMPTPEQIELVKANLDKLEEMINEKLGTKKGDFQLEIYEERKNIGLRSKNDLCSLLGRSLVKTLFTELNLDFWGGQYIPDKNSIWFVPKIWYKHPGGGSNGTDFIWSTLYFNCETQEWEGRAII